MVAPLPPSPCTQAVTPGWSLQKVPRSALCSHTRSPPAQGPPPPRRPGPHVGPPAHGVPAPPGGRGGVICTHAGRSALTCCASHD